MSKTIGKRILSFILAFVLIVPLLSVKDVAAASTTITKAKATSFTLKGGKTTISFKVNQQAKVKVKILDKANKTVRTLSAKTAKKNKVVKFTWNGKRSNGKYVAAGTYKAKIYVGKKTKTVTFKAKRAATSKPTPTPSPKPTPTPSPKPTPTPTPDLVPGTTVGEAELMELQNNFTMSSMYPTVGNIVGGGRATAIIKCNKTGAILLKYGIKSPEQSFAFQGEKGKSYKVDFNVAKASGAGVTGESHKFYVVCGNTTKTVDGLIFMGVTFGTPSAVAE